MMKPILYLHIGLTKTGSTSIQVALDRHRVELAASGVYIQNKPTVSHSLLPASIVEGAPMLPESGHFIWGGKEPAQALAQFRSDLHNELTGLPTDITSCVISSEHISDWILTTEDAEKLSLFLSPHFHRVQVIVYLRRQDRHLASNYNEFIKSGQPADPAEILRAENHPRTYDYDALLSRFAFAFGKDAIAARIYERDWLKRGNVVEDFFSVLGVNVNLSDTKRYNEGLNLDGQRLLVAARDYLDEHLSSRTWQGSQQWAELVELVAESLPGEGWRPSADQARRILAQYAAPNESVRAAYFSQRPSLFSQDYSEVPAQEEFARSGSLIKAAIKVILHKSNLL